MSCEECEGLPGTENDRLRWMLESLRQAALATLRRSPSDRRNADALAELSRWCELTQPETELVVVEWPQAGAAKRFDSEFGGGWWVAELDHRPNREMVPVSERYRTQAEAEARRREIHAERQP